MSETAHGNVWDFTPVHDLLRQFSIHGEDPEFSPRTKDAGLEVVSPQVNGHINGNSTQSRLGLGNFDRLWEYLGQPNYLPAPCVPPIDPDVPIPSIEVGDSEESKDTKAVRWRDEIDGADLADDDDAEQTNVSGLSKKQRKKLNRKKRRQALADTLENSNIVATGSESESGPEVKEPSTVDRRSIIYSLLQESSPLPVRGQSEVTVLKKRQPSLDPNVWPVARPHMSNGALRASSVPGESAYIVAAARKKALLEILSAKYPNEKRYLEDLNPISQPSLGEENTLDGVHIFVDASNILIGFHDAIKIKNGLSLSVRLPRQPLSFHNLSLVLTRGRPTAKKILVGSDNFPAVVEARTIGYEANILDRVHKTKELTARQRFFANGNSTASAGSGSESNNPPPIHHAMPKWTEQAVDEILHLKMLESIIDTPSPVTNTSTTTTTTTTINNKPDPSTFIRNNTNKKPSSSSTPPPRRATMVLATGDAAEAEYSGGFLKMVERALTRGWKVELASFRANTSGMYRRRDFREKWKDQFEMVELDEFVECLMGVEQS